MKYIKSNPNPNGGIGHQFMNWFVGLVMAKKLNCKFVHTPLISERSGGNWDNFLNFGEGYKKSQEINLPEINLPDLSFGHGAGVSHEDGLLNFETIKSKIKNGPDDKIYSLSENTFPGILGKELYILLDELRRKYRKVNQVEENDRLTVSFHLRRGDINPNHNPGRWESNEYYIKWMDRLREFLIDVGGYGNPRFILFSTTGETGSFEEFPDYVDLRIDGGPFKDFHTMITSDILFSGLSSYSILAAVLNENFCFYLPLQSYCEWMENEESPYSEYYSNAYDEDLIKLKEWLNEYQ